MGLKDIFKLALECPAEYVATTFNISSNIISYFSLTNTIVFITWVIVWIINNKKIKSRSVVDNLDDKEVRNKYLLFVFRLTSIYLVLLIIFIFYGVFYLDSSCGIK